MYLEHFGLGVNPFGLSPKLDFLYKSGTFEESIAHLVYGVDNSEAIVMITGAIGTGKTMSLHSFLANLGTGFHSALVTNTQVDSQVTSPWPSCSRKRAAARAMSLADTPELRSCEA